MDFGTLLSLTFTFGIVLVVWKGVKIVPQQEAWIVEKLGRFDRRLIAGLNILIPFVERVAYKHSLKEYANDVQEQSAITRDNVTLIMDGVIYTRITDAKEASYGVSDPIYAVTQLAQTTMRSEIGKLTLDECFEERERLNANIVNSINEAAQTWGIQCMRYEIRNITPPNSVLQAMELQVAAERQKRAEILESEGKKQAQINIAEAQKTEVVLESEAAKTDQINRAQGEASAIREVASATAEGIRVVADSIVQQGGSDAVALKIAEQYVNAFGKIAKESNTVLLPANANDAGSMVAQAMAVFNQARNGTQSIETPSPWKK
jgi:regulator of protease activity HflC (stomatin/prohibitin superfamily)